MLSTKPFVKEIPLEGYFASGTYTDVFTGANSCDSTRTLNLVVTLVPKVIIDTTICFGELVCRRTRC